jgi:hypothetical protein
MMTARTAIKEQAEILKNGAKYQAVKAHVKKNQKFYLGVGVGAFVVMATRRPAISIVNTVSPSFMPIFNNTVNNGGHIRKIVRCLETGELWLSVTEAAAAQGKTLPFMSRHLNHPELLPTINNMHFVIEALASG